MTLDSNRQALTVSSCLFVLWLIQVYYNRLFFQHNRTNLFGQCAHFSASVIERNSFFFSVNSSSCSESEICSDLSGSGTSGRSGTTLHFGSDAAELRGGGVNMQKEQSVTARGGCAWDLQRHKPTASFSFNNGSMPLWLFFHLTEAKTITLKSCRGYYYKNTCLFLCRSLQMSVKSLRIRFCFKGLSYWLYVKTGPSDCDITQRK